MTPHQNTGVIIKPQTRFGAAEIPTLDLITSDWRTFESSGEWQKDLQVDFETNACMSFAANDTLQTYLNWLSKTNQLSSAQLNFLQTNGYITSNGIHFSDRYTAKLSDTTQDGNDFENVWGSIEENGLVPESLWPFPMTEINANPGNAWAIYYAEVPANIQALGKQFLDYFKPEWRWLVSDGQGASQSAYIKWLQTAPIHVAISVCDPWNTSSVIQGCGPGAEHGVQLSAITPPSP